MLKLFYKLNTKKSLFLVLSILLSCVSSSLQALTYINIYEFRVQGNSVLGNEDIQRALKPYLGSLRTVSDVDKAAAALKSLYKLKGYPAVVVEVPGQDLVAGIVKLKVNENKVRRIKVNSARYVAPSKIKQQLSSLEQGQALHLPSLQKQLSRVNGLSQSLKLVPVLTTVPGQDKIDIELNVADKSPFFSSLTLNNYHSAGTTPTRLTLDLGYRNLWQKFHDISLQLQTTPENTDEVQVAALSYLMPIAADRKLAFYGLLSDSQTQAGKSLDIIGSGMVLGMRFIQPLQANRSAIHSMSLGFDYKDFDELIDASGVSTKTPIDYLSLSAQYNGFLRAKTHQDQFSLGITWGMRGAYNQDSEFDNKRDEAAANFFIAKADWKRSYKLSPRWNLSHKLALQHTDSNVVGNEQFSAGGTKSVVGYFESQILGDRGVVLNIDLKTKKFKPEYKGLNHWQFKTSLDLAQVNLVWVNPLQPQSDEFDIAGFGIALNSRWYERLSLNFDLGVALMDIALGEKSEVEKGDIKATGQLKFEF